MAAAAHARLAQSYAVGTLYLPSRHVPNRSDGANLPASRPVMHQEPRTALAPRSRLALGRSECLRRPLGAANAAWSVGAAGATTGNFKEDAFARS